VQTTAHRCATEQRALCYVSIEKEPLCHVGITGFIHFSRPHSTCSCTCPSPCILNVESCLQKNVFVLTGELVPQEGLQFIPYGDGWGDPKMELGQERRQVSWIQVSKPGFVGGSV
jgi:hypothetical protein